MAEIAEYIKPLLQGQSLTFEQAASLLDRVFDGECPEAQIAAFLTAMQIKGPAAAELAGLAKSLRSHAVPVKIDIENLVDTCGTGGSAFKTFNISTAAAIVAAGAGVHVAKHGNRGITSKCGSADVLEELGVRIDASPQTVADCIKQARIGFMFAPMFHPAMKYVQPIRKSLGFRTVFNVLGPLANPAGVKRQVLGVADEKLMPLVAEALKLLGAEYAMVVHAGGMDEISTITPTKILELEGSRIATRQLDARDLGIGPANLKALQAPDAKTSAELIRNIVSGEEIGPCRDIVVLNAAAAIITGGLAKDFAAGMELAQDAIAAGAASESMKKLIEVSNQA
ncbi:MAG TPA: anthranilate phosphoribosyltransferase [Sedimentisphaerales bacterium]|nr:anthranilate phosphoribosyltransferase [Sedimentisphaerales bacterium]